MLLSRKAWFPPCLTSATIRQTAIAVPHKRLVTTAPAAVNAESYEPLISPTASSSRTASSRVDALRDAKPFSDFLTDTFHRQHDYLRISVTERCNLRCLYCMPADGIHLSPNKDLLTSAEIYYLSALFVDQGVSKIRLTGGEPTVRNDIVPLMQRLGSLRRNGLKELALTTNAISLHRKLDAMVDAGLTGVNISLDTLDPFQFQILTRRQGFEAVMKSIHRVQEMNRTGAGVKLKINCVAMRGLNDHQILPFVEMTREQDIEVRFIEYMPFGGNRWSQSKMLPYAQMLDIIRAKYPEVQQLKGLRNDTSKTWQVPGFQGRIGFITSMTENFCGSCNRLRITSDGNLKVCLHGNAEVSLRDILRNDHNGEPLDEAAFEAARQLELDRPKANISEGALGWISKERELLAVIGEAVKRKKAKHAGMGELENMKNRPMILIDDARLLPDRHFLHQNSRDPPYLGQRSGPLSSVPLHLLSSPLSTASIRGVRAYSTGSVRPGQASLSHVTQPEDSRPSETQQQPLSFQSLTQFFLQETPEPRYSRPRRSDTEEEYQQKPTLEESPGQSADTTAKVEDWGVSFTANLPTRWADSPNDKGQQISPLMAHTVKDCSSPTNSPPPLRIKKHSKTLIRSHIAGDPAPATLQRLLAARDRAAESGKSVEESAPVHQSQSMETFGSMNPVPSSAGRPASAKHEVHDGSSSNAQTLRRESLKDSLAAIPEAGTTAARLTHVKSSGDVHMVDIGSKDSSRRIAIATAFVRFSKSDPVSLIVADGNKKGDVLAVARIAGIMAAKQTSDLIPLCHPIALTKIEVDPRLEMTTADEVLSETSPGCVRIQAHVECIGPTGVEMEALCAVNGAALTIYDMCKSVDRHMSIESARVVYKSGGRSGTLADDQWLNDGGWRYLEQRKLPISVES